MTSYLRSWVFGESPAATTVSEDSGIFLNISPPSSGNEDDSEDEDNDTPPAFPALSSAQRLPSKPLTSSVPSITLPGILNDSQLMPPPPLPSKALRVPGAPVPYSSSSLTPSTLALPPTTTKAPLKSAKRREKVGLAPGFGPLDWAALKASGTDLRVRLLPPPPRSIRPKRPS